MLPIISVVVSVFNSEKTVEKCLNSIINQPNDIEIICVDDGSTDKTVEILKKYNATNTNMVIIEHSENLSLLRSRYDGVMAAKGKYIMFADDDDYYLPGAFSELSIIMENSNADMVNYNVRVEGEGYANIKTVEEWMKPNHKQLKGREIFDKYLKCEISCYMWNKIIKSSLCKKAYSHITPEYINNNEDRLAMFFLSYYADTYIGIEEKYYVYVLRKGSLSQYYDDPKNDP